MFQIREWRISTWMIPLLQGYVRSMPSVASLVCGQCGSCIDVRKEDGMSSSIFVIDWNAQKPSHCKHVLVLTNAGKLSISCAHSQSEERPSPIASGVSGGTSSIAGNSAKPCGCDPGARHVCDEHNQHGSGVIQR